MKFLFPLVLLFFWNGFGQSTIEIDSTFSNKDLFGTLYYYHDLQEKETITSIAFKEFQVYNKSFSGLKNTKFWFQFNLANTLTVEKEVLLKIKTHTISNAKLYKADDEDGTIKKIYTYKNSLNRSVDIPIVLNANEKGKYFIEVQFNRSIYFPARVVSKKENEAIKRNLLIENTLYYGFCLVVFFVNLLFFINTKNKFFLFYCFLLTAITLSFMETQGMSSLLFNTPEYRYYILFVLNVLLVVSHMLFTSNALELKTYYPKHTKIGKTLVVLLILFYLIFFITSNFIWFIIAKIIFFLSIVWFWLYGILLFKKLIYARFYTLAYFFLLFFETLYIFSTSFGINQISEHYIKIGSSIEMIVFLYAISFRHKEVENKKEVLVTTYAESLENIKKLEQEIRIHKNNEELEHDQYMEWFKVKYNLTTREIEVLKGSLKGLTNKEIANELCLSEASIKHYNGRLFEKTNLKNKIQLITLFNSSKS